ncbi:hypothetical protein [Chondromyces apiculatus]|uniref:Uncharacterized protein n=1 Tax=Chondromyces apiculatus DSM 436 TaxID=1192034 RepID=A0A017SZ92_9BACT|nr:hypothetical protein [Chondromyces apiculatus]EYF01930.1 Hypothetical protein CAP_7698 [Chondromyces apiculatus DSM 436]
MAKLNGLALSSLVAGALITLAASSAQAAPVTDTAHLDYMNDLVASLTGVDPAENRNNWASASQACAITWANGSATPSALTKGACFFTLALSAAYPSVTGSQLYTWWGGQSPSSPRYYDLIEAENHFWQVDLVEEILPGDVLSTKYLNRSGVNTGNTMVVADISFYTTLAGGTERYIVTVVDSTNSPHGQQDTRYDLDYPISGVGSGLIFLDADPVTGGVSGHSWSNQGQTYSSYYTITDRPLVVGRFDRNK